MSHVEHFCSGASIDAVQVRANRQDLLDSPLAVEHPDTRKHKGRNAFRSLASPYEKPITIRS